jgi:hypothetical protein
MPASYQNLKNSRNSVDFVIRHRQAWAKENIVPSNTSPTQSGERVSQGLSGVRQAAKERRQERFTALLHHMSVGLLRDSFYALKRQAARAEAPFSRDADSGCQLPNQFPKSPSESRVTKPAACQFLVESLRRPARSRGAGTSQSPLKQFSPFLFWHLAS